MWDRRTSYRFAAGMWHLIAPKHIGISLSFCASVILASLGGGCTPALIDGAAHNDIAKVQSLIDRGVNVNLVGQYKSFASNLTVMTALHAAAYEGHNAMAQLLLEAGADVNARTSEDMITPLYMACHEGHRDVVNTLIEHGADIDVHSYRGWTALCSAASRGDAEIVKALLENGAEANLVSNYQDYLWHEVCQFTPLYMACSRGHADVAELLLDYGAEIDKPSYAGMTPLHVVALQGNDALVTALIDRGANVGARDKNEETPLHWAARRGRAATVELLISRGADPDARNKKGRTYAEIRVVTDAEASARSTTATFLNAALQITRIIISADP